MKKSVRKNGIVREYKCLKLRVYAVPTYEVVVASEVLGYAIRLGVRGQGWEAHPVNQDDGACSLEGFVSRTRAAECILKLAGYELV